MKLSYWALALPVIALTGCNSSSGGSPKPPTDSLSQISIISKPTELTVGDSLTLEALATWESGKTQDISTTGSWTVTPMDAASLNGNVLTAIAAVETASLTLSYQGKSDSANFTIISEEEEVTLDSIKLSEAKPEMLVGETQSLKLTAFYSNDQQVDVTEKASWSSSDTSVADVQLGTISAQGVGSASIQASFESFSQTVSIEVLAPIPELESVAIRGGSDSVIDGYNVSFEAWALYSDESEEKITEKASWTSSDENVATFNGNVLQSHSDGNTEITLTFEEEEAKQAFTVLPAVAESILPNISSNNTLQITEDDKLHNTVSVELSNGKTETFSDAEFVFNTSARDEQGYVMLEVGELYTRALRSGETEFELKNISSLLQKRLKELGIGFELEPREELPTAKIALEVTDNPNIYQWNQEVFPDPEGLYLKQMFTQGDKVYFVWAHGSSFTNGKLDGVSLSWFDGSKFSEPVKVIDHGYPSTNYMIDGGGNGYWMVTLQLSTSSSDTATYIVELSDLENTHRISFDDYPHLSRGPTMLHVQGAVAFDEQGNLVIVSKKTMELTFHKYFPETQTWREEPVQLRAERIAQQIKHPNHLFVVQQERSPQTAPISFLMVNLSDLSVEKTVPLQFPQGESEYCETNRTSGYHLALGLTDVLEKFAVHCNGKLGATGSAPITQRLLWADAKEAPYEYTLGELSPLKESGGPVVSLVSDQIIASSDYTKDIFDVESLNIDRLIDSELKLHTRVRPDSNYSQSFDHAFVNQNTAYNTVLDTSFLTMENPHVDGEAVFIYQDGIAVIDLENNDWSYDDALYGTKYWGNKGDYMRYLFVLNGEWHMLTHFTNPRQLKVATFQMRNPNALD